ncbi:hypothetical protein ACMA34_002727 [Salmonella enterica subsp. enterica serovar Kiambu]|uniref:Uncharacterized protein n=3 Tax=Salmonella enterica TaxID=28901 RepID=A0A7G6AQM6_SALET|nr:MULTISPECIES: hypothetical protein [Salmonella]EEP8781335.1 hypothetical protein [Salmonella enterica subsp. enterica serovar Chailey]MBJ2586991.1 hypothetical protein [Salmonella enterica subsp. enterica serovar Breda]MCL8729083.1 hypothetical protein [Salmonella enterica subsp. enterica serovar Enteritidis]EEC3865925.1 hypothetical protein [Salmonella enterica]EEC4905340.1 hypothetical protein [Salmonella enterica]
MAVGKAKRISASRFVSRLILSYRLFFEDAGEGAAIFTFIIIRVNHNYFFIYNVLSLFFFRWRIAIFRKIVILCSTGCMTKEWGLCQRKPEAGSGLLPVVAVPSGAIFTVKPWPVLLDHYILRSYLGN